MLFVYRWLETTLGVGSGVGGGGTSRLVNTGEILKVFKE